MSVTSEQEARKQIFTQLVAELSDVNNYSKRFHHAGTGEQDDVPEPRELKTYVERTLSIIHN